MNAVAVEKPNVTPTENGATKVAKKKSKNNRKQQKNSEPVEPEEKIHNANSIKIVQNGTKNGLIVTVENGRDTLKGSNEKLDTECHEIKENGCGETDHNCVENGESIETNDSKKALSRNRRKKRQKYGRNSLENESDKVDKEPSTVCEHSDQIVSNNNNIIDKSPANDEDTAITNGTSDCRPLSATKSEHANQTPSVPSSPTSSPESQSKTKTPPALSSSSPSTSSSTSTSSKQPFTSSPVPSTSRTQPSPLSISSSSRERVSYKVEESQGHESEVKQEQGEKPSIVSIAQETGATAAPTDEDGAVGGIDLTNAVIEYKQYESELQMQDIMRLIQSELSEPYSIYTYRYFIYNWPKLCFLAAHGDEYVGAIVCKLDMHMTVKRGYIAMLAVKREYRKMKIGTTLVEKAIEVMLEDGADEVVLETEMKNTPALRLYENLGFVRDKRLFRYYLNGVDALRLKLWFR